LGMKVAIVGANGFIGRNLLLGLAADYELFAFDLGEGIKNFISEQDLRSVYPVSCDLTDSKVLTGLAEQLGKSFDAVIYLAGNGDPARSVSDPAFDLRNTTLGMLNFLDAFSTRRFIYFSSGAVYDGLDGPVGPDSSISPVLPYAIGKYAAERYIHFFSRQGRIKEYVILRFFGAYGPYEPPRKIYTKLVKSFAIERNKEFTIRGDGRNLIDAMFVDDTVRAVKAVLESLRADLTLDFCLGEPYTLRELVEAAARTFGIDPKICCEGEVPEYINFRPSADSFSEMFDFKPRIPLEEGLRRLAEFLRPQPME